MAPEEKGEMKSDHFQAREAFREYAEAVSKETGIELDTECIFLGIAFPASEEGAGVANKYYGLKEGEGIEARGIALRHSDACSLVKSFQRDAAKLLLAAGSFRSGYAQSLTLLELYNKALEEGVPLGMLAITKSLNKAPGEYKANAPHVAAYRKLLEHVRPGEGTGASAVTYVWTVTGPVPLQLAQESRINLEKYSELLGMALEEMVRGLVPGGMERKGLPVTTRGIS